MKCFFLAASVGLTDSMQKHDKAGKYRNFTFPHYDAINTICAKVTATGKNVVTSTSRTKKATPSSVHEPSPVPSSRGSTPADDDNEDALPPAVSQSLKVRDCLLSSASRTDHTSSVRRRSVVTKKRFPRRPSGFGTRTLQPCSR
jgi:hypothetical protein